MSERTGWWHTLEEEGSLAPRLEALARLDEATEGFRESEDRERLQALSSRAAPPFSEVLERCRVRAARSDFERRSGGTLSAGTREKNQLADQLLQDLDEAGRRDLIEASIQEEAFETLPALVRQFKRETDPGLRQLLAQALGMLGGRRVLPYLKKASRSRTESVRRGAVEGLAYQSGRGPAQLLLERLADPSPEIAARARELLGLTAFSDVAAILEKLPEDRGSRLRKVAVPLLRAHGERPEARALLERWLHSSSNRVAAEALLALASLGAPAARLRIDELEGDDDPRVQAVRKLAQETYRRVVEEEAETLEGYEQETRSLIAEHLPDSQVSDPFGGEAVSLDDEDEVPVSLPPSEPPPASEPPTPIEPGGAPAVPPPEPGAPEPEAPSPKGDTSPESDAIALPPESRDTVIVLGPSPDSAAGEPPKPGPETLVRPAPPKDTPPPGSAPGTPQEAEATPEATPPAQAVSAPEPEAAPDPGPPPAPPTGPGSGSLDPEAAATLWFRVALLMILVWGLSFTGGHAFLAGRAASSIDENQRQLERDFDRLTRAIEAARMRTGRRFLDRELGSLVPQHLEELPRDPWGGAYAFDPTLDRLYSPGPDGVLDQVPSLQSRGIRPDDPQRFLGPPPEPLALTVERGGEARLEALVPGTLEVSPVTLAEGEVPPIQPVLTQGGGRIAYLVPSYGSSPRLAMVRRLQVGRRFDWDPPIPLLDMGWDIRSMAWFPDGQELALVAIPPGGSEAAAYRLLPGESPRLLPQLGTRPGRIRVSRTGDRIAWSAMHPGGRRRLVLLELQEALGDLPPEPVGDPFWGPEGEDPAFGRRGALFYCGPSPRDPDHHALLGLLPGRTEGEVLRSSPAWIASPRPSRTGARVAFVEGREVKVLSLESQTSRTVLTSDQPIIDLEWPFPARFEGGGSSSD